MGATGQRLRIRLFLEGVEIPVIAAQVQVQPNSPAVCSIQIPPLAEGTRFLPRTTVHLFFLDFYEVQSPLLSDAGSAVTAVANGSKNPTLYERSALRAVKQDGSFDQEVISQKIVPDFFNERYKLLFGGEVIGFQWTKDSTQRSLVLQCADFSNYWDYAYQWNNTDLFGPGVKALFSGGGTNLFTDFLEDEGNVIARIIKTKSITYPALKGLLGGIVHLLEAIGGSYQQDKQIGGQNIFFSIAELRLHIIQMITAFDKDNTAARLLDAQGWDGLFGRILGNLGQQVSIRSAINALMGVIFHETYAIPTPLFVPGTDGTISGFSRKNVRDDPRTSFIAVTADRVSESLTSIVSDLQNLPTDISVGAARASIVTRLLAVQRDLKDQARKISSSPAPSAGALYSSAASLVGRAITRSKSQDFRTVKSTAAISGFLNDAIAQMEKARALEFVTTPKSKAIPARLNSQIFRPDIWFSSPPRCNVLFPENYLNVSYQRSFLGEPTRLLLKTNDAFFGEDELFDQFYYAPKSLTVKGESNSLQASLRNDLLDHELYTGVLPVFEKMSELNIFAVRSGTVDGKVPKVGLAQRSCNFLYFKYRFAARQMQISGKFNPYVAPGFPGLIIDKYADQAALQRYQDLLQRVGWKKASKALGTNFLGNFTEVTHILDQNNGMTQINCSYPRQPEESVEFLGAVQGTVTVKKKTDKVATPVTAVAALFPPRVGSLGPKLGEITKVEDITASKSGQQLPLYRGSRNKKGLPDFLVMVNVAGKASSFGPEVVEQAGDPNLLVRFKGYRVTETSPQYKKGQVELTPEELIRPGWYSDVWAPQNISQAYEQFFKIGSINDPIQVSGFGGPSLGALDEASQLAQADETTTLLSVDETGQQKQVFTLTKDASIEQAVAYLVATYSFIKHGTFDIDEFIRAYTWRPIATMVDMFGTFDLDVDMGTDGTVTVRSGIEGFHSRAFGPFENLFGLTTPDIQNVLGIKRNSNIAQKADKRKIKQDAVLDYVSALSFARAILG